MNKKQSSSLFITALVITATIISMSVVADILFDNHTALAQQVKNPHEEGVIGQGVSGDYISREQPLDNNDQQQESDCSSSQYFHAEYKVCLPNEEKDLSDREKFREQIDVEPGKLDQFNCREGDVLAGVHNPGRLMVLSPCQEIIGRVGEDKGLQGDGDRVYLLDVDEEYKHLLNEENDKKQDGMLVVEIIPADQDSSFIKIPKEGDRIHIVGAWVTDEGVRSDGVTKLGWNELHPTWKIEILE
jgi:hypothetical protein